MFYNFIRRMTQDVINSLKSKLDSLVGDVREQKQAEGQSPNGRALAVLHTDLQKAYAWLACHVIAEDESEKAS